MVDALSIEPAPPRAMLAITAFRETAPVVDALASVLGMAVPDGPRFARKDGVSLSRLAPARFLVMAQLPDKLSGLLRTALQGLAAVIDQSDAWAMLAVRGAAAPEVLARVVPLDPGFQVAPGAVILTRVGAMDVGLWKLDEGGFEIMAGRSMGRDLLHTLRTAALSVPAATPLPPVSV